MRTYPAERLINESIEGGWIVKERINQTSSSGGNNSTCYLVERHGDKGFLKAFDYRDLAKTGSSLKRITAKFERERDLIKKCSEKNIDTVIKFISSGKHFLIPGDLNELVDYFIIEYSNGGNIEDRLTNNDLIDLQLKFEALSDLFDGLHKMHREGIIHLDIKPSNLVYFISDRLTKITDFGSARQWVDEIEEDMKNDIDRVIVTRAYAPPEHLYNSYDAPWKYQRRKIDLYLAGNVIVKLFTNYSFTALLKTEMFEADSWNNNINHGKLKQIMPKLLTAATKVYLEIEREIRSINIRCKKPLSESDINQLMTCIRELCSPNYEERGYPKVIRYDKNNDGLDRYRDRFVLLSKKASYKLNKKFI